ncbi:Copper-transporting ATPase [Venturia nashicola]|nr:Copper-transporting ATPase [Venturia nashicola]
MAPRLNMHQNTSQSAYRMISLAAVLFFLLSSLFYVFYYDSPPLPTIHPPEGDGILPRQKRAYATFFSTRVDNDTVQDDYFTAVRVLTYQLLHHPETRTKLNIPLLILVAPHVSEYKRQVLVGEGATIVPVELFLPENNTFSPADARYRDQFCKIRLFAMTQYDRILYMDTDMLLTKSIDGIWDEPSAQQLRSTILNNETLIKADEAPLPPTYLFTGVSDAGGGSHPFPPVEGKDINGGFWMMRPDATLFDYYRSIMDIPNRFDSTFMEQAMLTYAHRRDGPMPWTAFPMGLMLLYSSYSFALVPINY